MKVKEKPREMEIGKLIQTTYVDSLPLLAEIVDEANHTGQLIYAPGVGYGTEIDVFTAKGYHTMAQDPEVWLR